MRLTPGVLASWFSWRNEALTMIPTKASSRVRWSWMFLVLVGPLAGLVGAQEGAAKPKPQRPDIYDAKADARAQVEAATARARRDNQRVLVMFGGNWCGWCHKLHELFASDREIHTLLNNEYVLVMVDTEAPHAVDLLKECKAALSPEELQRGVGYPFLAVLDANGKILTAQRTDPLEEGDHHDPKKVKDFLAQWTAEPKNAQRVLDEALSRASSEDKRIFLHFGAPWCGWCHKLDDFLARPEIAAIISRDFLDVKIDVDRMTGGQDVLAKFRPDSSGGIPWFAVLDPKGQVLATSDGPKGNIGYPAEPHEIDHFLSMLRKTTRRIEPRQIDRIESVLKDTAKAIKGQTAH
jgi:thioredoxin-related protein